MAKSTLNMWVGGFENKTKENRTAQENEILALNKC